MKKLLFIAIIFLCSCGTEDVKPVFDAPDISGKWNMVEAVYDGAPTGINLYINGAVLRFYQDSTFTRTWYDGPRYGVDEGTYLLTKENLLFKTETEFGHENTEYSWELDTLAENPRLTIDNNSGVREVFERQP
jgi:hypothetical protein